MEFENTEDGQSMSLKRKVNFSKYEKELLSDVVKAYPIITSSKKDAKSLVTKGECWEKVKLTFNADEKVHNRTSSELKTCFDDGKGENS